MDFENQYHLLLDKQVVFSYNINVNDNQYQIKRMKIYAYYNDEFR